LVEYFFKDKRLEGSDWLKDQHNTILYKDTADSDEDEEDIENEKNKKKY